MCKTRKPSTPGEILVKEFMEPNFMTTIELAKLANVHRNSINAITNNRARLSPLMAARFGCIFNTTTTFWLNLQQAVDLWELENNPDMLFELSHVKTIQKIRGNG